MDRISEVVIPVSNPSEIEKDERLEREDEEIGPSGFKPKCRDASRTSFDGGHGTSSESSQVTISADEKEPVGRNSSGIG